MRNVAVLLFILLLAVSPAPACSLCGNLAKSVSLLQEFEQADAILYGRIANPKLTNGGLAGSGTTEFHVEKLVKEAAGTPREKMLLLTRYLPILDAKEPPRYVMFFRKDGMQPYSGREVRSAAILDFVRTLQGYGDNQSAMLLFAFKHLDHADPYVADEAFLVFAKANDKVIAEVAKKLEARKLRQLIKTPNLEPERLSLFAYLLGACGDADDAELLRSFLKDTSNFKAFEGILAGYITLRPQEGWAYTHELVKSDKASFLLRFAALRTLRFFYNAQPEQTGNHVIQTLGAVIARSDVADVAIGDLRNWKRWEHTKLIVSCYDKGSHKSPIVKSSIVRYALSCPQPEARALVERVRREDPALIRYLEEELK